MVSTESEIALRLRDTGPSAKRLDRIETRLQNLTTYAKVAEASNKDINRRVDKLEKKYDSALVAIVILLIGAIGFLVGPKLADYSATTKTTIGPK